jgi:catechol 2,3-dioxygenase-like lactoylglutathione lyase family enzyme
MFNHVGLRVRDAEASARFYAAILEPLGYVRDATGFGFGPMDAPALWLHQASGEAERGVHVAFDAPAREAVDEFHAAGRLAGATDNGAPGLRADYGAHYYAAFLVDADGNNIEAVCLVAPMGER